MADGRLVHRIKVGARVMMLAGDESDHFWQGQAGFNARALPFWNYLRREIKPDAICVDVGANIGLMTLLLAEHCQGGHVYAIEASPRNAETLRYNLKINDIRNCTVIESAVGDESGQLKFLSDGAYSHVVSDDAVGQSITAVPVARLDDIARDFGRIDFMKMDVEGFEPNALAGARDIIERWRFPVFMEFNSWCLAFAQGYSQFAFAKALWSAFDPYAIQQDGLLSEQGDVVSFLHRNATTGCVDDILLKPRPGVTLPSLADMVDHAATKRLRAERDATRS